MGLADIDKTSSGFQQSDLVIIAGGPSVGEATLVLSVALAMILCSNMACMCSNFSGCFYSESSIVILAFKHLLQPAPGMNCCCSCCSWCLGAVDVFNSQLSPVVCHAPPDMKGVGSHRSRGDVLRSTTKPQYEFIGSHRTTTRSSFARLYRRAS